jgi:hypothetical protein
MFATVIFEWYFLNASSVTAIHVKLALFIYVAVCMETISVNMVLRKQSCTG